VIIAMILCTFLLFFHFSVCSFHFWTYVDNSLDAIHKILLDSDRNCYLEVNHVPPMLDFVMIGLQFL